jgi:putative transposase
LSVGVGLGVVHELMELEVDEVVGAKGEHNPERAAKRHGHEDGSMTLGGRRVQVRRPRIRSADDTRELPVETYAYFADRDPLTRAVMDRMLAGVSTRKFARVGEPVGAEVEVASSATSKTSVSDLFVERTRTALGELMSSRLDDVRLAVMMLDGLEIADRTHVVALGITTDGVKIPLGLWEGSTENATLARTLLADLVDRGLDLEQAILFVIDGGKALRRAIKDVFGEQALVHRCHRHKERNVTDLLPERDRDTVRGRMRAAWSLTDAHLAEQRLELLAGGLERARPDAASSLREGMHDTLTLMRLGITGNLA